MENTLLMLWHSCHVTMVIQDLDQVQGFANYQETGIDRQQHAAKVMKLLKNYFLFFFYVLIVNVGCTVKSP